MKKYVFFEKYGKIHRGKISNIPVSLKTNLHYLS